MAEIDLITSHAPWSRVPRLIGQADVGDGSVFEGMPQTLASEADIWPDRDRVRQAYFHAVTYSLRAFVRFLTTYGDDDLVVVMLATTSPPRSCRAPMPGTTYRSRSSPATRTCWPARTAGAGGLACDPARRAGVADGRLPGPVRRDVLAAGARLMGPR